MTDRILNVSFSVRHKVERNADVFYSPQFLRERVYLQRTRLTMLSTLEVRKPRIILTSRTKTALAPEAGGGWISSSQLPRLAVLGERHLVHVLIQSQVAVVRIARKQAEVLFPRIEKKE